MEIENPAPKVYTKLKFRYSEKITKFCEISPLDLTVSKVVILQNFVAFSQNLNFAVKLQ